MNLEQKIAELLRDEAKANHRQITQISITWTHPIGAPVGEPIRVTMETESFA